MRVAAIELLVHVASRPNNPASAVLRALTSDPDNRNAQALSAISEARKLNPAFILCPGWTFVGAPPKSLARVANGATVIFEVLSSDTRRAAPSNKLSIKGAPKKHKNNYPWNSFVLENGIIRKCPSQVVAQGQELNTPSIAEKLAQTLMSPGRLVGRGRLVTCGEVNVIRFRQRNGERECIWDPLVASAGVRARDFAGHTVFNPAHTPSSSYMHRKRRLGPWKNIVTTANQLDYKKLGCRAMPSPTRAYVDKGPLEAEYELNFVGSGRVLLFNL
jgi:hypothetical protein